MISTTENKIIHLLDGLLKALLVFLVPPVSALFGFH